jgi:hypothetical protein
VFVKRFVAQRVYTVCTRINYKIVPVTNLNNVVIYRVCKMSGFASLIIRK